ncbi:MAG: hypothetical protein MJA83_16575 [Gammaproteobacteria bacterium]|nr:hypothetical protein [Gammaproteobacteria bacterium]
MSRRAGASKFREAIEGKADLATVAKDASKLAAKMDAINASFGIVKSLRKTKDAKAMKAADSLEAARSSFRKALAALSAIK